MCGRLRRRSAAGSVVGTAMVADSQPIQTSSQPPSRRFSALPLTVARTGAVAAMLSPGSGGPRPEYAPPHSLLAAGKVGLDERPPAPGRGCHDGRVEPLHDGHGRRISDLRVSVTARCNFRCQYCMPADGLPWLERAEVLRFEEIERLVRLLVALGVRDVRLTGGEPLVRRDFPVLASILAGIDGLEDLSLTTNGYLLERDADALAAAGITRVNVSIDTLQRDRFFQLTRRDALPRVLRGLDAIARHRELRPIKVNAVAMRGV